MRWMPVAIILNDQPACSARRYCVFVPCALQSDGVSRMVRRPPALARVPLEFDIVPHTPPEHAARLVTRAERTDYRKRAAMRTSWPSCARFVAAAADDAADDVRIHVRREARRSWWWDM